MNEHQASNSERFLALMELINPLEWYGFAHTSTAEGSPSPPSIIWRWRVEDVEFTNALVLAVHSYAGTVSWYCGKVGRNWILTPELVLRTQKTLGSFESEALKYLSENDTTFSKNACDDLDPLLNWIESTALRGKPEFSTGPPPSLEQDPGPL